MRPDRFLHSSGCVILTEGSVNRLGKVLIGGGAAVAAAALWWRKNPSACPYAQRFWIEAPHPFITRRRLLATLRPQPGERVLEVGPGTGYYTIDVARELMPGGTLEVLDVQRQMLDHTMRRATAAGVTNIVPSRGDARLLPYEDATFDAAFLVTVLGEVPDQDLALREVNRVLKNGGRLVVGELFGDPHMVPLGSLRRKSERAGFSFDRQVGSRLAYFALLHK